jgi:hypothetical protein
LLLHELLEIIEEDDKDGTIIYNDPVEDFTGNYRVSINDCRVKPALEKKFTVPLF